MARRNPVDAPVSGFALPLLLGLVALLVMLGLAMQQSRAAREAARAQQTARALREARDALLAYAVQRHYVDGQSDDFRPGELPCPDRDNDGNDDGSCSAGEIGRVPWKSLGISPPVDGDGEVIWYALSGRFRRRSLNPNPINSLTRGDLRVLGADGSTVQADDAVFIVFSAGAPLTGQNRSATLSAPCAYDNAVHPENLCADNYLDAHAGASNAKENGPFIAALPDGNFNDGLLAVRSREYMHLVEQRVGREALGWLKAYRDANGVYPYPAAASNSACFDHDPSTPCTSSETVCSGRFPESALTAGTSEWPQAVFYLPPPSPPQGWTWPVGAARTAWFRDNEWSEVAVYAIDGGGCGPPLRLDNQPAQALVMLPGTPVGATLSDPPTLAEMLEDAENQDAWNSGGGGQLRFVTPSELSNDQVFVLR